MSDRLRAAYQDKEDARIKEVVREINKAHLARMHKAGREFKARRKEKESAKLNEQTNQI